MQHTNREKKCPTCRNPFNPIEQVMPNFGLLNYMAELRRNRSRSPRNLRARGSIGRVIHQPRTPPELIPAPVTPVPAPESPAVISPELADWMNSYESQHRVL